MSIKAANKTTKPAAKAKAVNKVEYRTEDMNELATQYIDSYKFDLAAATQRHLDAIKSDRKLSVEIATDIEHAQRFEVIPERQKFQLEGIQGLTLFLDKAFKSGYTLIPSADQYVPARFQTQQSANLCFVHLMTPEKLLQTPKQLEEIAAKRAADEQEAYKAAYFQEATVIAAIQQQLDENIEYNAKLRAQEVAKAAQAAIAKVTK